jgi:hypothetical protein
MTLHEDPKLFGEAVRATAHDEYAGISRKRSLPKFDLYETISNGFLAWS